MTPTRLPLVAALAAVASLACATLQTGREQVLKPSMVSSRFKAMDADNPFEKKATRVTFLRVGIKSYDAFFAESATTHGTVVLADVVLKDAEQDIAAAKRVRGNLGNDEVRRVNEAKASVAAVIELLEAVPANAGKLLDEGGGLAKGAGKVFTGQNAVKLPGVVQGLQNSMDDLKSATAKAPKVLDRAKKASGELAKF